jgi:hypothetical protein
VELTIYRTLIQTSVDQKSTFTTVTATSLSTHSITVTSLTTVTEHPTVTSYSTLFGNTIQSIPVPYTSVTSATTVLTITSGTPSTVTVYNPTVTVYSTAGAAQKRDLNREARSPNQAVEAFGLVLDKRVAASTASQTIPAYASACTDFAEYAAACSKAGVSRSTSTVYSTLPAVTTTSVLSVTSTSTIVVTQLFTSQVDITVIEATTGTKVQTLTDTSLKTITITQTYFSTTIVGTSTVIVASFTTVAPTTTTSITPTVTACVPAIPSGNIITNPGFNDGTFTGWNPGGNGGFSNLITNDAQCGAYRATFAVSASYSYSRIGQSFSVIDTTKRYKITTYAKFVSGNPANCMYYLSWIPQWPAFQTSGLHTLFFVLKRRICLQCRSPSSATQEQDLLVLVLMRYICIQYR